MANVEDEPDTEFGLDKIAVLFKLDLRFSQFACCFFTHPRPRQISEPCTAYRSYLVEELRIKLIVTLFENVRIRIKNSRKIVKVVALLMKQVRNVTNNHGK